MQLAVNQFYKYQPASKWAFDVNFSNPMLTCKTKTQTGAMFSLRSSNTFTEKDLQRISQSVVSITQPKYDIEAFTNTYGNFDFVIPMYDVNNIRLTVTFEDTDDCLISYKFLTSLMGGSKGDSGIPLWLNVHETILITITEYNTYLYDIERPNNYLAQMRNYNNTTVKSYFCKMIEYTEPNYNRAGENPSATTMTITFLAVPAQPAVVNDNPIFTNGVEEVDVKKEIKETLAAVEKVFETIGYSFKSLAYGWMKAKKVNLKDVFNDMMSYFGDVSSLTYSQIEKWFKQNALVKGPKGISQCARGPNLLFQLYQYIESGEAAAGKDRDYVYVDSAAVFKKGTGTTELVTGKFTDVSGKYEQRNFTNPAEFNKYVQERLQAGEYITFSYIKADGKPSQHIVFKTFDKDATGNDIWWSDFRQGTATAMHSGTNFTIIDSYSVQDTVIDGSKLKVKNADEQTSSNPTDNRSRASRQAATQPANLTVGEQPATTTTAPTAPATTTTAPSIQRSNMLNKYNEHH